jgi:hypothetical protein
MKHAIVLAAALALAAGQSYIGRLDTIGGTTYDWWSNSGAVRLLVNSPQFGIHAVWMYSTATSGTDFPDRNTRYNCYDFSNPTRQWTWADPVYMLSGVDVFPHRTGYGVIAADTDGIAVIVAHSASGLILAIDAGPGYGIFNYDKLAGYYWLDLTIGDDGTYHIAMSPGVGLSYTRIRGPHNWDSVRTIDSAANLTYEIAASKAAPSLCATWASDTSAFYLLSDNRGDTWSSPIRLDPPPAFGGDTVTRFSMYGLFPFFDSHGRVHVTAAVYPEVRDTAYSNPAEIWHWCPDNQPNWARIHHAGCAPEHLLASVGYDAIYADRPTMGEGRYGEMRVAWEQFDSSNVEPTTNRLRAGIWLSGSSDNGLTWTPGVLVTGRNTYTHRFPSILDRTIPGASGLDTVCVLYLMDSVAGSFVQGEGPATRNPVICQFISSSVGVKEYHQTQASSFKLTATIVRGMLELHGLGTRSGLSDNPLMSRAVLLDAAGRKVLGLKAGANDVSSLPRGVYFVRAEERGERAFKVVIQK